MIDNASSPATALANAREAVERNAAALLTDGTGAVSVAAVTDPREAAASSSSSRAATQLIDPPPPVACSGSRPPTRS